MSVKHRIDVMVVSKQKGQIQNHHALAKARNGTCCGHGQIDCTYLHSFQKLPFPLAKLASRVDTDIDDPTCSFLDASCKFPCPLIIGVMRNYHGGKLQFGDLGKGGTDDHKARVYDQTEGDEDLTFHINTPFNGHFRRGKLSTFPPSIPGLQPALVWPHSHYLPYIGPLYHPTREMSIEHSAGIYRVSGTNTSSKRNGLGRFSILRGSMEIGFHGEFIARRNVPVNCPQAAEMSPPRLFLMIHVMYLSRRIF